ncbi:MAG: cytochrome c oxidase subunit II [Planctomycetota bacterium]|jgi:cytochrome c oxidase subunit 2
MIGTFLSGIPNTLASTAGRGFWMPEQASTVAESVDWVYMFITWLCTFFFVLIVALMAVFMIKYRRRSHAAHPEGPVHHTALEVTWTAIPLLLVVVIFYVGMKGYFDLQEEPEGAYEVYVTASKWSWNFQHRNGAQDFVLDVPAGRDVKLILGSQDVLHSLFIPAFRVKQDVVPGRYRSMWFNVPDDGSGSTRQYDLFCTEYCGTEHSSMTTVVNVVPEQQWEAYIEEKARIVDRLSDEQLPCYAAQRLYPRCASCHSLDGVAKTGPSFKGLWDRVQSGETVFTNGEVLSDLIGPGKPYASGEDYIRQSILKPQQHIVMNFAGAMPAFQGQLQEKELLALIQFLKDPYAIVDEKGNLIVDCDLSAPAEGAAPASDDQTAGLDDETEKEGTTS